MDDRTGRLAELLHTAGETHHTVFKIVEGDDPDWASWYSDWLLNLSELPALLGVTPVRSELTYWLVRLDKEYTEPSPTSPGAALRPGPRWSTWARDRPDRRDDRVVGPPCACRADQPTASARAVRRRSVAWRRHDARGRRPVPRLLQAPRRPTRRSSCCWPSPSAPAFAIRIEAMFRGERINVTEDRAVLHVALRAPRGESIEVDGVRRRAGGPRGPGPHGRVQRARPRRAPGRVTPASAIRNVVNIGIGGSDLGPAMAYRGPERLQPTAT